VLIVDDDPVILTVTSRLLAGRGFACETVQDGRDAVVRAVAFGADIVLLDVHMEPVSGFTVLKRLRTDHRTALTPVICVTSDRDPAVLVALLGGGADDFIGKPFKTDELAARILVAVRRRAVLGSVNPLTGLPGNVVLTAAIARRLRDGVRFALLHIDIDSFKAYNDHYGFVRGDHVISTLGRLLDDVSRGIDARDCVLAHIGGDDFALLVPAEQAVAIAEAAILAFDRVVAGFYDPCDAELGRIVTTDRRGELRAHPLLTVSIGIATTQDRSFASAAAMADVAVEVKCAAKRRSGSAMVIDRRILMPDSHPSPPVAPSAPSLRAQESLSPPEERPPC